MKESRLTSLEEFEAFVELPANANKLGKSVKIFRENDTINLETVLPNFELKLSNIFKK